MPGVPVGHTDKGGRGYRGDAELIVVGGALGTTITTQVVKSSRQLRTAESTTRLWERST